jgi:hypothetical protein
MTQGQYGIGLLGFWSLGEMLEMRSAVPGQRPQRLVLQRDRPDFVVEPLRGRLPLDERWTEVVVVGLHKGAMGAVGGRRAADYLAAELRGQLLSRDVDLVIEDRMARGRAQKLFAVRPPRFLGERIAGLGPVEVEGYPAIKLELYVTGSDDVSPGIGIYSAGTLVAASFRELAPLGLDREPWTDARITGMIDFAMFRVAPGSRRGIVIDPAAEAFASALGAFEPVLTGVLEQLERQRAAELDRNLIRDLQRAFRDFYRQRPSFELLPTHEPKDPAFTGDGDGRRIDADLQSSDAERIETPAAAQLLPPGPMARVRILPPRVRMAVGDVRLVKALALDASDRPLTEHVDFTWELEGVGASLQFDDPERSNRVRIDAGERVGTGRIGVVARHDDREARADAEVEILEELPAPRANEGIPEPELVSHPGEPWRSRMLDGRWQVNSGHPEYRAIDERPALKLRYLAMLFAKEVVLRSHQDPRLVDPLEQLVEVAAYADRNLNSKRGLRRSKPPSDTSP